MKLLAVYTDGNYLVIKTDEGLRRQSLKWRGVIDLKEKAEKLIDKAVVTTTLPPWDPAEWFATIDEAPSPQMTGSMAPSCHPALGGTRTNSLANSDDAPRRRIAPGSQAFRLRPVSTGDVQATDLVVLASPKLQRSGKAVGIALGNLRVEDRTDANDGSAYVLVTVRGEDGTAQARFSEAEWRDLTTIGVVDGGNRS